MFYIRHDFTVSLQREFSKFIIDGPEYQNEAHCEFQGIGCKLNLYSIPLFGYAAFSLDLAGL